MFYFQQSTGRKGQLSKPKKLELNEEQKQEIREAFDLFDTDGSGESIDSFKYETIILLLS